MPTEALPPPTRHSDTLPPIVAWHFLGNPLNPTEYSPNIIRAYSPYKRMAAAAIQATMGAAVFASGVRINRDGGFAGYAAAANVPSPRYWFAYTCLEEAETKTLIRLTYGAWLEIHGHDGLLEALGTEVTRALEEVDEVTEADKKALAAPEMLGRLVVPDLVNGVMPGTPWVPDASTMSCPAWPKVPDEQTAALWRRAQNS